MSVPPWAKGMSISVEEGGDASAGRARVSALSLPWAKGTGSSVRGRPRKCTSARANAAPHAGRRARRARASGEWRRGVRGRAPRHAMRRKLKHQRTARQRPHATPSPIAPSRRANRPGSQRQPHSVTSNSRGPRRRHARESALTPHLSPQERKGKERKRREREVLTLVDGQHAELQVAVQLQQGLRASRTRVPWRDGRKGRLPTPGPPCAPQVAACPSPLPPT